MYSTNKKFIEISILFFLIVISFSCEKKTTDSSGDDNIGPNVGQVAPDFTLRDLEDNDITLSSFRGSKVVLLDFWATWCNPCVNFMPLTQSHHDEYANLGLKVLAINIEGNKNLVQSFMSQNSYTFTCLLDSGNWGAYTIGLYQINSIPRNVLIDVEGIVRFDGHPSELSTDLIENHLPH